MNKSATFRDVRQTTFSSPEEYKINYNNLSHETLKKLKDQMIIEFKQTQCQLELQMYFDKKKWSEDSDFCEWIYASKDRQAYFHLFNLIGYSNGWSVSMVADFLGRDRTACSKDLSDMQQREYIYRNKSEGYQRHYLPSKRLLDNGNFYANYYVDLTLELTEFKERKRLFELRIAEREYLTVLEKVDSHAH